MDMVDMLQDRVMVGISGLEIAKCLQLVTGLTLENTKGLVRQNKAV